MYLFKTSGSTFASVVENQKHAFPGMPRDWIRRRGTNTYAWGRGWQGNRRRVSRKAGWSENDGEHR